MSLAHPLLPMGEAIGTIVSKGLRLNMRFDYSTSRRPVVEANWGRWGLLAVFGLPPARL